MLTLPGRNCARTPMHWSSEPHGGFTASAKPVLPVIESGPYGFTHVNVAAQRHDPNSMLDWTERMLRMCKEVPEIGWGDFAPVACGRPDIVALRYTWRNNAVVVLHHLGAERCELRFRPGVEGSNDSLLVNLLSGDDSAPDASGAHGVLMEPYGYRWFSRGRTR